MLYLLIPVLLLIVIAVSLAVHSTSQSVNALFDEKMENGAEILISFLLYKFNDNAGEDKWKNEDEDDSVAQEIIEAVYEIESGKGLSANYRLKLGNLTLFTSGSLQHFPNCDRGFSNFEMISNVGTTRDNAQSWRCFQRSHAVTGSEELIVVELFERAHERQQALRILLLSTFVPLFLLPLLLVVVIVWAVNRAMASLKGICADISQRSVDDLKRLNGENRPTEFLPVVESVNGLLDGIERGVVHEKQFAVDAAHELRTPLTSIKMYEQLLRRANKDAALNANLDDLRNSVERSSHLIEQLLIFSKLQTTTSLSKIKLNLVGTIRIQLALLSAQLTMKALGVEFSTNDESLFVQSNEPAMHLLLANLLSNTVKFSHSGDTIFIYLTENSLRIEDNGLGIIPEYRERIFDRFFRVPGSQETPGSGLGLSMAKWVADAHGFTLSAQEPSAGAGACIVLEFNQRTT